MPAIQLAKLKIETNHLAEKFHKPSKFVRDLHALCDHYAERTRRPGQSGEPPPLLSTYKVPAPVLRQVVKELSPYVEEDNTGAIDLADALWQEPYLEFRLLAASILGMVEPLPVDRLIGRLNAWVDANTDDRLLTAIMEVGLARLREEQTGTYTGQIRSWLDSEAIFPQRLGLRGLLYLLKSQKFENVPAVMRLIAPLVRSTPARLRADIVDVIQVLARLSPKETAYFLRQNLELKTDNPGTAWVIRHSLNCFPIEIQASLRHAMRSET